MTDAPPPYSPAWHDPDFNRISKCVKVSYCVCSRRTSSKLCTTNIIGCMVLLAQNPAYRVLSPGQYILRDSSLNYGGRQLSASGAPLTYLGTCCLRDFCTLTRWRRCLLREHTMHAFMFFHFCVLRFSFRVLEQKARKSGTTCQYFFLSKERKCQQAVSCLYDMN